MMRALLISMLLLPVPSRAADLDDTLERMEQLRGAGYLDARARAVAFGVEPLRARVAAAPWTASTWRADAMAAVALAWAERPEACARVYALEGLDPAIYLARRRPGPEVGRELRHMRDIGPILYEALVKSLHRFSTPASFPERLQGEAEQLIAVERAALRVGVLAALGRSGHPVAAWALAEVLRAPRTPAAEQRAAAIALGEAGGEVDLLLDIAGDSTRSRWLRGGAVIGIAKAARTHERASVDALRSLLGDPDVRRPAISGLAITGSSWGTGSDSLRAEIAALLAGELAGDAAHEQSLVEALSVVGHPAARERLEQLRRHGAPDVRARAERALRRMPAP